MSFTKEDKQRLIETYARHSGDTGSPEVQIALLTQRITALATHFQTHKKDNHSRRGLVQMVNRRRALLDYLKKNEMPRYQAVVSKLGLRK